MTVHSGHKLKTTRQHYRTTALPRYGYRLPIKVLVAATTSVMAFTICMTWGSLIKKDRCEPNTVLKTNTSMPSKQHTQITFKFMVMWYLTTVAVRMVNRGSTPSESIGTTEILSSATNGLKHGSNLASRGVTTNTQISIGRGITLTALTGMTQVKKKRSSNLKVTAKHGIGKSVLKKATTTISCTQI